MTITRVSDEWLEGMRAHVQSKTTHDPLVQLTPDEAKAVFDELVELRKRPAPMPPVDEELDRKVAKKVAAYHAKQPTRKLTKRDPGDFTYLRLHVGQRVKFTLRNKTHEGEIKVVKSDMVCVSAPHEGVSFDRVSWDACVIEVEDFGPDEWVVGEFDWNSQHGSVNNGLRELAFDLKHFRASTERWPLEGEDVELKFDQYGALLSVHGK